MAAGKIRPMVWRICAVLLLIFTGLLFCDPLYRFALWLSYSVVTNPPMWPNGFFIAIDLPASVNIEDVVLKSFSPGRNNAGRIIEIRRIWMIGTFQPYWAARVEINGHPETLLIHFSNQPNPMIPGKMGYWELKPF
jgi:hypothetical protein